MPDESARFVRLEVSPTEVVFATEAATSQLRAVAVWSDGLREDVTALTRFETKDDAIADVSANGLIDRIETSTSGLSLTVVNTNPEIGGNC